MVLCSLLMLVGRLRDGRVTTFCFAPGCGRLRAWRIVASPTWWTPLPFRTRARLAGLMLAGLRVVCLRSGRGCSCRVVGARLFWPPVIVLLVLGVHFFTLTHQQNTLKTS